ncbi:hypothetical protein [Streptomyces sp. NPDC059909]|uniref:hypothetical protein n=1 Tax=Streptomyces sp. NPDC059909 TaxID=3346998 RepID=UPI003651A6AF
MMAGVATTCEECGGQRFQAAVLDHPLGGRTIAEVPAMPAAEAVASTLAVHKCSVYFLAEPTTGLRPADVEQLVGLLDRLVDSGKPGIAIEHLAAYLGMEPRCSRTSMKGFFSCVTPRGGAHAPRRSA